MGGQAAGEVASAAAARTISRVASAMLSGDYQRALTLFDHAVADTHRRLLEIAAQRPGCRGLGTTLSAVFLDAGNLLRFLHVGDSGACLWRGGILLPLTREYSVASEAVASGLATLQSSSGRGGASLRTRFIIGDPAFPTPEPVRFGVKPLPGDRLLLATDGLWDVATDELVARILAANPPRDTAADALVEAALAGGAEDNITVIVTDIVPAEPKASRAIRKFPLPSP
jgi:PPM family protein phosphatase